MSEDVLDKVVRELVAERDRLQTTLDSIDAMLEARGLAPMDLDRPAKPRPAMRTRPAATRPMGSRRGKPGETVEAVAEYLAEHPGATAQDLGEALEMVPESARKAVNKLVEAGRARMLPGRGRKPGRYFLRSDAPKPAESPARIGRPPGENREKIVSWLRQHGSAPSAGKLADESGVPKGSISGVLVALEREQLIEMRRGGPTEPVEVVWKGGGDNGQARSAQAATV
jgi:DNA-binding MarR family transcriptional regulator